MASNKRNLFVIAFVIIISSSVSLGTVPSYEIYEGDFGLFRARNILTGVEDYSNFNASTLISTVMGTFPAYDGGKITILNGTYPINNEIILNRENVVLVGEGPGTILTTSGNNNVFRSSDINNVELGNFQIQATGPTRTSPLINLVNGSVYGLEMYLHDIDMVNTYHQANQTLGNDVGFAVGRNIIFGIFDDLNFDNLAYPIKVNPDVGFTNSNRFSDVMIQNYKVGVDMSDAVGDTRCNTFDNFVMHQQYPTGGSATGFIVKDMANFFTNNVMTKEPSAGAFTAYDFKSGTLDNAVMYGDIPSGATISDLGTNNSINYITVDLKYTQKIGTAEASSSDWVPYGVDFAGSPQTVVVTVDETDQNYTVQVRRRDTTAFQIKLYDEVGNVVTTDKTINWYAKYNIGDPEADNTFVDYIFNETSPGTWEVFIDVDGGDTAGLSAYSVWVDNVDPASVSYEENVLGTVDGPGFTPIGFQQGTLASGQVGDSFNAGNFQSSGDSAILGIGMVEVYEEGSIPGVTPLVDLDVPALLGTLTTQPGLGEGDFRAISVGLLNAVGDGFLDASGVFPEVVVIPFQWLEGDANRDGFVSADDYAAVQAYFGDTGDVGILGDANLDGVVSADDYASVQANFGSTAAFGATIPEPTTMGLLAMGGLALLKRKRGWQ